jgi:hypothetical protein
VCVYYCSTYYKAVRGASSEDQNGRKRTCEIDSFRTILCGMGKKIRAPELPRTQLKTVEFGTNRRCHIQSNGKGNDSGTGYSFVVPHSTCPSLSPSPPAHSFIIGPAVINTHTATPDSGRCDGRCNRTPHLPSHARPCLKKAWQGWRGGKDQGRAVETGKIHILFLAGVPKRVYGCRLFIVSARTNKRHHHHFGWRSPPDHDDDVFYSFLQKQ